MENLKIERPISKGKFGNPQACFRVVDSIGCFKVEYTFVAVLFMILSLVIIIGRFN